MKHKRPSKKHVIILFFSLLLLVGGLVTALGAINEQQNTTSMAAGECTITAEQMQIKQPERTLFELINNYRKQNGKSLLKWSDGFKKPAAWMSKDMLTSGKLSHTDSLGRDPDVRLEDCGAPVALSFGENIANGAPSAREVFDAWVASPPHNQILLNTAFTQGAVAMETDETGEVAFWTLDVGSSSLSTVPTNPVPTSTTINPTQTLPGNVTPIQGLTPTNGRQPTPTTGPVGEDVQISVKVRILGIGSDGNASPKNLTRRVTAQVYGVNDEPVATGNTFLTYDGRGAFTGVIHLGRLTQGAYFIKLATDNSLQTLAKPEFQNLMINKVNIVPEVTLYQGDINRDNTLNIDDYNAVLPCFQDKRCDSQKDIDFNDDGTTDAKDYNLLLRSFGQQPGN